MSTLKIFVLIAVIVGASAFLLFQFYDLPSLKSESEQTEGQPVPGLPAPTLYSVAPGKAQFAFYLDVENMKESPFFAMLREEGFDRFLEGAGAVAFSMGEGEEIWEELGIELEDIEEIFVTAYGIDPLAGGFAETLDTLRVSVAVRLGKPLKVEEVQAAVVKVAGENLPPGFLWEEVGVGGDFFFRPTWEGKEEPFPFLFTLTEHDGGVFLYLVSGEDVGRGIARGEISYTSRLATYVDDWVDTYPVWAVFEVSDGMRGMLGSLPQLASMGPDAQALQSVRAAGFSLEATDGLEWNLMMELGGMDEAEKVERFVRHSVWPMARMAAQSQGGGALKAMETIELTRSGGRITQRMKITAEEILAAGVQAETVSMEIPGRAPAVSGEPWPAVHLQGVLRSGERRTALINGEIFRTGEGVAPDVVLRDIRANSVVLQRGREFREIETGERLP